MSEEATARDISAAELAELTRRARERTGVPPAGRPSGPRTELEFADHEATCPACHRRWAYRVVLMATGEAIPPRQDVRVCGECEAQQKREADERAERVERERAERDAAERETAVLDMLRAAGANPWEHGRATLDGFQTEQSGDLPLRAARQFVAEVSSAAKYQPVRGLYMLGDTGTGKTYLAVAIMRELLSGAGWSPRDVVFDHALRLIGRIQDTYNTGESAEAIIERRINARLWILDDLGTEKASDDVVRRLTDIFTERALRPTVVTSNVSPEKLEGRHPAYFRVQSRLGPAYFRLIRFQGDDRRFA